MVESTEQYIILLIFYPNVLIIEKNRWFGVCIRFESLNNNDAVIVSGLGLLIGMMECPFPLTLHIWMIIIYPAAFLGLFSDLEHL